MKSWKRTLAGAAVSVSLLAGGWAVPAHADADGKVDVAVGTTTVLDNAPVDRATRKLAELCGGKAEKYVRAARKADRTGAIVIVCTTKGGRVNVRP